MLEYSTFNSNLGPMHGWRFKPGGGRGIPTPAIDGNRVLVGGGFGSYEFYCLDLKTGKLLWQRRTNDDGPTAAVTADGLVIYNTESCTLEAVEIATGEPSWSHWLGDPLLAQPAADSERTVMVYPKNGVHELGAFSNQRGEPLWATRLTHDVISAPVLFNGHVYLSTFDGEVWAFDARDGRLHWRRPMNATSAPWVHDGFIYVSCKDGTGSWADGASIDSRFDEFREEASTRHSEATTRVEDTPVADSTRYEAKAAPYFDERWGAARKGDFKSHDAAVGFGSAPAAAKLGLIKNLIGEDTVSRAWRYQGSRPVVQGDLLIESTGDLLEARERESGKSLWTWKLANSIPGERRLTPPAAANGRVWAGTWDGRLLCWEARTGQLIWEIETGAPCHWQPALSNGRICAGLEDGSLVCVETRQKDDSGWPMWGGGPGHNGLAKTDNSARNRGVEYA